MHILQDSFYSVATASLISALLTISKKMIINNTVFVLLSQLFLYANSQKFLSVSGNNLTLNGEKVFLSGMNQAWFKYARDFGKQFYSRSRPHLLKTLDHIQQSGGNSVSMYF